MKLKYFWVTLLFSVTFHGVTLHAQDLIKPRMSVNYIKDYKDVSKIKVLVRYKEDRTYLTAENVKLSLYKRSAQKKMKEDLPSEPGTKSTYIKIDDKVTNKDGEVYFYLKSNSIGKDTQYYKVALSNSPKFKDKEEVISFQDAVINASLQFKDSVRSLNMQFVDAYGEPLAGQYFTFRLKRLFGLMQIGEEPYYKTDDDGKIEVEIEQELFSKSGDLNFLIKLDDNDTYGTIIEQVTGKFGTVMESKDSFDERTMWASPLKAPLLILIVPNILLLGIWGTILILIVNLYKIYKT